MNSTDVGTILYTDGRDPRFAAVCQKLDEYLNELVGGETQRSQYAQFNTPEAVSDVLLLLENGQAIASAGFKRFDGNTAEVKRVWTEPACRKQGLGHRIMAALEARARERGYTRLILETGVHMTPAIRFYTTLGFQRIQNYAQYRDMPESVCMEKLLG